MTQSIMFQVFQLPLREWSACSSSVAINYLSAQISIQASFHFRCGAVVNLLMLSIYTAVNLANCSFLSCSGLLVSLSSSMMNHMKAEFILPAVHTLVFWMWFGVKQLEKLFCSWWKHCERQLLNNYEASFGFRYWTGCSQICFPLVLLWAVEQKRNTVYCVGVCSCAWSGCSVFVHVR